MSTNKPRAAEEWDAFWQRGVAPGQYFDVHVALPELVTQLRQRQLPAGGRALVPGCGRGYDVQVLCESGFYDVVIGLDISETAVKAAKEYLDGKGVKGFQVVAGDFFAGGVDGTFNLVYDYTFFCAIPREWREKWGARMKQLVQVGGVLVTVMFPYGEWMGEEGPPFTVEEKAYREVLEDDGGFVCKDGPRVLSDDQAHKERGEGRTMWCVWERI